jgi:general stress protein 26
MALHDPKFERIWELIETVGICMLTTRSGAGLRARPLEARAHPQTGTIRFVTDVRGAKDDEVAAAPEVCLTFIDKAQNAYLSLTGDARIVHDPAQAAEIWRRTDDVWWPQGPHDPNARVLIVEPRFAELWDGPASRAVALYEFVRARVTGEKPNLGEKRKVTVEMR